jgi:hypothetical protein
MSTLDQAFAAAKLGETLSGQGRWDEAAAAFHQALAVAPQDALLYNNLAVVLYQGGRGEDAIGAFHQAIALDANHLPAHVGLAFALLNQGDRAGAVGKFRDVVRLDPRSTQAHMALYHLLQLEQQRDQALAHQAAALEICRLYSNPCTGAAPQASILVLKAPGDLQTNIPLDLLFDRQRFSLHDLYLVEGRPEPADGDLPPYDLVFNAISESQRALPALAAAERFIARQTRPALNPPALVRRLSRDQAPALFAGIDDCYFPPTLRLSRTDLTAMPAAEMLAHHGLALPIVMRPLESHAGSDFERLDAASAVEDYLARVDATDFYVAPFVDYRSPDGLYRKYRIIFVEGVAFPCHLAISRRWMIHYLNADMEEFAWMRAEEERFMADLSSVFSGRLGEALTAIAARSGLDYVGMDCSIDVEGRVLVFEIDAAMIVHLWDSAETYPYKHRYIPRIFAAVEDMVMRRINELPMRS